MRKQAITNSEVIDKLISAGLWTQSELESKSGPFHKQWRASHNHYVYGRGYVKYYYQVFNIPVGVYKEHCARYAPPIKKGAVVRLRTRSSRSYERTASANDIGDNRDFGHLGIGSGKLYIGKVVEDLLQKNHYVDLNEFGQDTKSYSYKRAIQTIKRLYNKSILIGNERYPVNMIASDAKVNYHKTQGHIKKTRWSAYPYKIEDFLKYISVRGDGVFGPKKLINGVVTEVYVHFLYPKWERKRETRFKVLFETGASGIFTSDYLERVYDVDYDGDEKLHYCGGQYMDCQLCHHQGYHKGDTFCTDQCNKNDSKSCLTIYDYNTLLDKTCGKALDYVNEID